MLFHALLPNLFEQLIFVRKLSGASRQRGFAGSAGVEHFRQMRDAAEAGAESPVDGASNANAEFLQPETRSIVRQGEIGRKGDAGSRGGADDHPQT